MLITEIDPLSYETNIPIMNSTEEKQHRESRSQSYNQSLLPVMSKSDAISLIDGEGQPVTEVAFNGVLGDCSWLGATL